MLFFVIKVVTDYICTKGLLADIKIILYDIAKDLVSYQERATVLSLILSVMHYTKSETNSSLRNLLLVVVIVFVDLIPGFYHVLGDIFNRDFLSVMTLIRLQTLAQTLDLI